MSLLKFKAPCFWFQLYKLFGRLVFAVDIMHMNCLVRDCSWTLHQHDIQVISCITSWLARSLFSEVARQLRAFITPCLASFLSLSFFSRCVVSLPPVKYVIILTHNKTESSHFFACHTRKRFLCSKSPAWPRSVVQFSVCRNGPVMVGTHL